MPIRRKATKKKATKKRAVRKATKKRAVRKVAKKGTKKRAVRRFARRRATMPSQEILLLSGITKEIRAAHDRLMRANKLLWQLEHDPAASSFHYSPQDLSDTIAEHRFELSSLEEEFEALRKEAGLSRYEGAYDVPDPSDIVCE